MTVIAKLLTFIFCAFIQFHIYPIHTLNIVIMLIAIILSSIPLILNFDLLGLKGLRIITTIYWTIYLIASLSVPELQCYIPLAIIDIFSLKLFIPFIAAGICIISECINEFGVFIILLSLLVIFLQYIIEKNETFNYNLKYLRDNSKEHELLIEEKNRRLIEKQDTEIYMATLKERNRIAREIHDNVGHMLTRSILQVGAIKTINSNETLSEPLQELHNTLNIAMTNIRNSVHDLHDESVDLLSAIKEITAAVDTISIKLDYDMNENIPKNIKYCFISIIKEAVNNMLKHSNATQMNILVHEHPAFYQLLIHDNGTNINMNSSDGIGLSNMKDRIKSLNGNIKISTESGFKILISIIKERYN